MSTSVTCASSEDRPACEAGSAAGGPGCQFSLMEMSEVEYLQHMIQSHMEAPGPETGSSGFSQLEESVSALQEIRMLRCEATPDGDVEVPGSVLDRAECAGADGPHRRGPLERQPSPPARVCLEKRFLSVHCHSTNISGISSNADKMGKTQGTYPHEGHLLKTSELLIPAEVPESFRPLCLIHTGPADLQTAGTLKNEVNKAHVIKRVRARVLRPSDVTQRSENWRIRASLSCAQRDRTRPLMDRTQRKEVHNRKERDRRRRIRLCCDELNLLVPFCYADTDKATTLQWTTAFLKYIQEIHGDCLKQDFQRTFCGKTGLRLKPSVSVAHHPENPVTHT
ncbi:uncharacterized protein LOC120479047 [Pimephales promelas]|uniref:uncharacterized protein LOC120479047 n=1 Tax=Pimephales promelas TaxID=90988 RepID=UPI001955C726|nr:uncharacterized protein LOC120479047 [Pimephales promelas]KAG1927506.1 transcription factor-like 5 protein [Pimephales promelas]